MGIGLILPGFFSIEKTDLLPKPRFMTEEITQGSLQLTKHIEEAANPV